MAEFDVSVDEDCGTVILDRDAAPTSRGEASDDDGLGLRSGDRVGRYRLVQRLGAGGMGVVWVAHDPRLERTVAIKLLHERRRRSSSMARERLRREALALARLSHPNVVAIYDVGIHEDRVFLAMEHIEGRTLDQWALRGPSVTEALDVFVQAAAGLAAVHSAGFVHRDFKPANVMIDHEGRVLVMDFGLARIHDPDSVSDHEPSSPALPASASATLPDIPASISWSTGASAGFSTALTGDGVIMGTPAYMAPEQHLGEGADARADQFSFCVALFEMVIGRRPYQGKTAKQLASQKIQHRLDFGGGLHRLPGGLRRLLRKGIDPEPARRFPNMLAVRRQLLSHLHPSVRRRPAALLAVGALGLGAAGWASLGGTGPEVCDGGATAMTETWNDEARARLHRSFSATALSYAADAARRTTDRLDTYAEDWVHAFHDACAVVSQDEDATAVLDLRMDCLDDAHASMGATLELLVEADATT
nr:serine/threonine protein kinase [Deltaproteobacteria bacterium]